MNEVRSVSERLKRRPLTKTAVRHFAKMRGEWRDEPSGDRDAAFIALDDILRRSSSRDLDWIAYLWDEVHEIPEFSAFFAEEKARLAKLDAVDHGKLSELLRSISAEPNSLSADERRRRLRDAKEALRRQEIITVAAEHALKNLWRAQGLLAVALLFCLYPELNRHSSNRRALARLGAGKLRLEDVRLDPELRVDKVAVWQIVVVQAARDMQIASTTSVVSVVNAWNRSHEHSLSG